MIDGHHRAVRRWRDGLRQMKVFIVAEQVGELWRNQRWLIPLTQVTPIPHPRVRADSRSLLTRNYTVADPSSTRRFLAVSGGLIACQDRCGGHLSQRDKPRRRWATASREAN